MDVTELLAAKRQAILELAERNGVTTIRVFGSVARGDSRADSDIDFLVEFSEERSLLDHSRLILDLEALLDHKVHVLTPGSLHHSIKDKVLREARPL
ncbi:MAG: nucleotidyltransferase family protein [Actinomycetota bacterium]